MLFDYTYREIESNSIGYYKERGSKFVGYCYLVKTTQQIKEKLHAIKKIEKSANHYCYAYVLQPDKSEFKTDDDGEPASTAGKPILRQIKLHGLTNILIIVVRYFGGTKLGIPGLIRSYKTTALDGIKKTKIIIKDIQEEYALFFKYSSINDVMWGVKKWKLNILESDFNLDCSIRFLVYKKKSDEVFEFFNKKDNIKIKYIKST